MFRTATFFLLLSLVACKQQSKTTVVETQVKDSIPLVYAEEKHFKNLRQVTFGGDNAEAYWSFDDEILVFQSNFGDWGGLRSNLHHGS